MKLQVTHYDQTITIEDSDQIGVDDMISHITTLLLAMTYHPKSIKEAYWEKARELEEQEGKNEEIELFMNQLSRKMADLQKDIDITPEEEAKQKAYNYVIVRLQNILKGDEI